MFAFLVSRGKSVMTVTQVGATDAAIRSCEEVLLTQPENIKALYRLGKVLVLQFETTVIV